MAKEKKQVLIEEKLWQSANKLRGSVEASEYKHVVLGLIFLKFASDKFGERRQELIAEGKEKYLEMTEFYTMKNVFYLPEISRWSYLIANAKQSDISLKIDTALFTVEKNNPSLKGALPDNYYSRLNLDITKLSALLDEINDIDTIKDKSHDIVGRVYEYFLSKFAIAEGKGKGEFYTPKSIVHLIAEMIQPYKGIIYDPACGSGGMFVQSMKFIEHHHGNKKEVSIYGQEYTATTYKLAKMNLAIRGISANLGDMPEDTFKKDQHKDLKADFIMANPPFNQKDWRASNNILVSAEEYISEKGFKNSSTKLLPINTVLMAMYGVTAGQVGFLKFKATTNQACCAMICEDINRASYLYYHLLKNQEEIASMAIGGAQPNLSKNLIEELFILDPYQNVLEECDLPKIIDFRYKKTQENENIEKVKDLILSKMASEG